jgi:hypothetical protein
VNAPFEVVYKYREDKHKDPKTGKNEVYRMSNREFWHLSGRPWLKHKRKKDFQNSRFRHMPGIWENQPSFKSSNPETVKAATQYFTTNAKAEKEYGCRPEMGKRRFHIFNLKRRTLDNVCKKIAKNKTPDPTKSRVIVFYGDATFDVARKGHHPAVGKQLLRNLRRYCSVIRVGEYKTSKACSSCRGQCEMRGMKRTIPIHEQQLRHTKKEIQETNGASKSQVKKGMRQERQQQHGKAARTLAQTKAQQKRWRERDAQWWYDEVVHEAKRKKEPLQQGKILCNELHGVRVHRCPGRRVMPEVERGAGGVERKTNRNNNSNFEEEEDNHEMVDDQGSESQEDSGSDIRKKTLTGVDQSAGVILKIWGRDTNAALNILEAGMSLWMTGERPHWLRRPQQEPGMGAGGGRKTKGRSS